MIYRIRSRIDGRYLRGYLPAHNPHFGPKHESTGFDGKHLADRAIRDCHLDRKRVEVTTQ
jgi:hypothetical protein